MSLVLESACAGDAQAIAEVQVTSLRAAYAGLVPESVFHFSGLGARAGQWEKWLERSRAVTLVARVDGTLAGFCSLHPAHDERVQGATAEIAAFYVLPSRWRGGVGRLLGERILSEASARGFTEVVLWVLESNERARSFYESLGFRADGTKRVFHEGRDAPVHDVRYRLSL